MRCSVADALQAPIGLELHQETASRDQDAVRGRDRRRDRDRPGHDGHCPYRRHARPAAKRRPKARWSRAVAASAELSAGPSVRVSTARSGNGTSGALSHASRTRGEASPAATSTVGVANASATATTYSARPPLRPRRTTRVRLPARRSLSTSRTLSTMRIAVARSPTGTAATRAATLGRPACTSSVPHTATGPKKAKTKAPPRPWEASGYGPAV